MEEYQTVEELQKKLMDLYEANNHELYRFAYYTLQNAEDAKDVVADTILAAYQQVQSLRQMESMKAWLFQILVNQCKRKMRQYYKKVVPLDDELGLCTSESDLDLRTDLQKALSTLSWENRMIISLSVFGGYKGEEIGQMMNLKHSTVRSRYRRAMLSLRAQLGDLS